MTPFLAIPLFNRCWTGIGTWNETEEHGQRQRNQGSKNRGRDRNTGTEGQNRWTERQEQKWEQRQEQGSSSGLVYHYTILAAKITI